MPEVASWRLTGAVSPRPVVRVAAVDAYGAALNEYTGRRSVAGVVPDRPWAVYLADGDRRFRLLCFDLDAHGAGTAAAAARDADVLAGLLAGVGLAAVVCQSGPAGGRHVWTALAEGVDGELVATMARLARHVCPTVDLAPLTNPATGCVRPPGAPHRAGGHSVVLAGDLATLSAPTGTACQVSRLVEVLAQLVNDAEPAQDVDPHKPLPLDAHGRLYLPGQRRELLPATSAAALAQDARTGDASAVLWRVLIGAASARWRHRDVAALVATAPGLEHVRTYRSARGRTPRTRAAAAYVLRRQWDKAVRYVATSSRQVGDDPTFDGRAGQLVATMHAIQDRADGCAGRWSTRGGPADRRVLDVLCVLALQALSPCVEADTRRLALLAGIGRETARTALQRLAADGWITQTAAASGPHAARWTITPQDVIHNPSSSDRSQADPRPAGAGSACRTALLTALTARTTSAAHDLFTHSPGLGHHAGNTYARTTTRPQTLATIARATGVTPNHAASTLDRLTATGALVRTPSGWRRPDVDHCYTAAAQLGVADVLADRARRYTVERELWAWWQAEHAWMRAPRRPAAHRRAGGGQLSLLPAAGTHGYGPHPRRADGRLDWRTARRVVESDRGGVALRTWTTRSARPPVVHGTPTSGARTA